MVEHPSAEVLWQQAAYAGSIKLWVITLRGPTRCWEMSLLLYSCKHKPSHSDPQLDMRMA